jgi:hypothetical protein
MSYVFLIVRNFLNVNVRVNVQFYFFWYDFSNPLIKGTSTGCKREERQGLGKHGTQTYKEAFWDMLVISRS